MPEGLNVGSIFARLGAHFDESGFDRFDREFAKTEAKAKKPITATVKADVDQQSFSRADRAFGGLNKSIGNANMGMTFFRNNVALLKWPALIAGAGGAAQAVSALAVGATALTAALGPATGALAAYPALASAAAQASSVAKLAFMGLGGASEDLTKQLEKPTVAGRRFEQSLKGYTPAIRELQVRAQQGLLPRVSEGLDAAAKNMNVLKRASTDTSVVLGRLAVEAGQLVGSKGFGRDLDTQAGRNVVTIDRLGRAGINLGDALRHVTIAAGPLVDWMTRLTLGWARSTNAAAEAGRESGRMAKFFESTRATLQRLGSISASLASAFVNIGKAAKPLGDDILRSLDRASAGFARWTRSVAGQNALRKYFADAKPAIFEMGRLLRDVTVAFFRLGAQPGVANLIRQVRTQLLPVLVQMVATTTAALGPALIDLLVQVGRLFGSLAGSSGPLVAYVKMLAAAARALANLLSENPALNAMIVSFAGLAAVIRAIKFVGMISGVKTLIGLYTSLRTAALGAAAAQGAAGAAGGAGAGRAAAGAAGGAAAGRLATAGRALGVGGAIVGATAIGGPMLDRATRPTTPQFQLPRMPTGLGAWFDNLTKAEKAVKTFGNSAEQAFARAVRTGNVKGLAALADRARSLARDYPQASGALNRFAKAADGAGTNLASAVRKMSRSRINAKDIIDPHAVRQLGASFDNMRKNGITSIADLRKSMGFNMTQITRGLREGSRGAADAMASNFGAGIRAVKRGMREGTISTSAGMKEIRKITREQMRASANHMGEFSASGRKRMADSFNSAAAAVKKAMNAGKISVRDGTREMNRLTRAALAQYGITGKQASRYIAGKDTLTGKSLDTAGGKAEGGFIESKAGGGVVGRLGERGRDKVHAVLGRGEAVINRHQQRYVNAALQSTYGMGLKGLFSKVKKPHWMEEGGFAGMFKGIPNPFAAGGYVQGSQPPSGPGSEPIRSFANSMFGKGFSVTSGGERRGTGTYHDQQRAVDWGSSVNDLGRLWSILFPKKAQFVELFGPQGSYKRGARIGQVPGHGDHIHTALLSAIGALGGALGGGAGGYKLPKPKIEGGGAIGALAQGQLDKVHSAAQAYLDSKMGDVGGEGGMSGAGAGAGKGTATRGQMVAWAKEALQKTGNSPNMGNVEKLLTLARKESGWKVDSMNLWDSNAKAGNPSGGLMHVTRDKMKGASLFDPVLNMIASINYQQSRYGRLITFSPYEEGGFEDGEGFEEGGFAGDYDSGEEGSPENPIFAAGGFFSGGRSKNKGKKRQPSAMIGREGNRRIKGLEARVEGYPEQITHLESVYSRQERKYGLSVEDFVIEGTATTPASIDQTAVNRRMAEIRGLIATARKIVATYLRELRAIDKIIDIYQAARARLRRVLGHTSKKSKKRPGLVAKYGEYGDAINTWQKSRVEVADQYENEKLDVTELRTELGLFGSGKHADLALPEAESGGGDGGGGEEAASSEPSADLQAQLEQAQQKIAVLTESTRISDRTLETFKGSGDIGGQFATAYDAARAGPAGNLSLGERQVAGGGDGGGVTININTLHPGDPAVLDAVARAANAGNSASGYVISPREQTGI